MGRIVGHVFVFVAVLALFTTLVATGLNFIADISSTSSMGEIEVSPAFTMIGLLAGLVGAIVVTVWRIRRKRFRPLWYAFALFMVAWLSVTAFGSYIRIKDNIAARAGPLPGLYYCQQSQITIDLTREGTLSLRQTVFSDPTQFTYDPVTRIMTSGADSMFALRYVPLGQPGSAPGWWGPGLEIASVVSVPAFPGQSGIHAVGESAWCPHERLFGSTL
ncbi:MAG: hypothetical protein WCP68_15380 [Enhydrobacter sp.]